MNSNIVCLCCLSVALFLTPISILNLHHTYSSPAPSLCVNVGLREQNFRLIASYASPMIFIAQTARFMGPTWGPSGPTGPRWVLWWPNELCDLGADHVGGHTNTGTVSMFDEGS